MQKTIRALSVFILIGILSISVTPAFAQGKTPTDGRVERPLREYVMVAFADALNLDLLDVQNRMDAGESYREIAASQGIEGVDFLSLMAEVIEEAVDQAIQDGVISEEDADRMRERYQRRRDFRRRRRIRIIAGSVLERLGITREELAEMRESGMSWAEICESLGVDIQGSNFGEGLLERLGLSREEIRERLEAGETLREIFTSARVDFLNTPER